MKSFVALALAASALASPMPQSSTPDECSASHDGSFQITVVNVTQSEKRSIEKRQQSGVLTLTLTDGTLKDQAERTGYIASNHQFQFDSPPQDGALKSDGFSFCSNSSLALDGSAIFYQCYSGGFYNLYDDASAEQCSPVYIYAISGGSNPPVSQVTDGQPAATSQGQGPISQISDGQPQAPTNPAPPVTQISDGQPQVPTARPSVPVVSQASDGQPQVPTEPAPSGPPVTQISDGQPQVPTAPAPAPSGPPVTQISDGQPQVPTAPAPAPSGPLVTQISDGQPQVPTAPAPAPSGPPVTQISDGQPQVPAPTVVTSTAAVAPSSNFTAPNATATSVPEFPGAATTPAIGLGALAAALIALVALL